MPQAIIRFTTTLFDISKEEENPINPIYGQSLLLWIRDKLLHLDITMPNYEDWGWYSMINFENRTYMLGASCLAEDKNKLEWILQIDKPRSLLEIILGKEKMTENDKCFLYFKKIIETESSFKNIEFA